MRWKMSSGSLLCNVVVLFVIATTSKSGTINYKHKTRMLATAIYKCSTKCAWEWN